MLNTGKPLGDNDYKTLHDRCIDEAKAPCSKTDYKLNDEFKSKNIDRAINIVKIQNLKGIKALNPSKPLTFNNKKLTIVYGANGTGKSGYVRLLKKVCKSRNQETILPNVFTQNYNGQGASITYSNDE